MLKTFTKEYFLNHKGCYSTEKMQSLIDSNKYDTIEDFLNWDISIKDKFYFVRNYTFLTLSQKQLLSLECAKVSLKIYEAQYPDDKRVSDCITATEQFLNGTITKKILLEKRNAANAAAANAAAANYAANYAAAAAIAAAADYAAAAANAANAATAADAADAADDDIHKTNLLNMLIDFCKNQPND